MGEQKNSPAEGPGASDAATKRNQVIHQSSGKVNAGDDHKEAVRAAFARDPGPLLRALGLRIDDRKSKPPQVYWVYDGAETQASLQVGGKPSMAGRWTRYGADEGGDAFDLVCRCRGWNVTADFRQALEFVAQTYNVSPPPAQPPSPEITYEVRNLTGELVALHHRQDLPDGGKRVWWSRPGLKGTGLQGKAVKSLPLYRVQDLASLPPGTPVVVAEGEKACDALRQAGLVAVATYGANALPDRDVLTPLTSFTVILWPDADDPGRRHMSDLATALQALGTTVLEVTWPDAPDKGDAADALVLHGPDRVAELVGAAEPVPLPPILQRDRRRWTAADLLNADFPEPTWLVPGILPTGLTLLAGRPKVGKSWLALQIAHAKGIGGEVFGAAVDKGRVLFLALEDSPARLADRMRLQHWPEDADVQFQTSCAVAELAAILEHDRFDLLVIDTFSRLFVDVDQDDVSATTKALGQLQELAQAGGFSVLLLDHHRKGADGDAVLDVLGSTGKSAVADTIAGLFRHRGERDATFKTVSRDCEEVELTLRFGSDLGLWRVVDYAERCPHTPAIIDALEQQPDTISGLARRLNLSKATVSRACAELHNAGRTKMDEDRRYWLVMPTVGG
jgi:hypothetical protein